MLKKKHIEDLLRLRGILSSNNSGKYADEYEISDNKFIYILSSIKKEEKVFIVDNDTRNLIERNKVRGVFIGAPRYSTSFKKFPKPDASKSNQGFFTDFSDKDALECLLDLMQGKSMNILEKDVVEICSSSERSATERQALIAARLGQGAFRKALFVKWNSRCAVTGIKIPELLKASHIKPWSISTDEERLDPHNGLLLTAQLDAAFDSQLISFDDNGNILFSAVLAEEGPEILGVSRSAKIAQPLSNKLKDYLKHHRAYLR